MMLADGWYKVALLYTGSHFKVMKVENDRLDGNGEHVGGWLALGFTFEPVVVLLVEEHAALVRDADMWRRLKELPALVLRTGED